VEPVKVKFGDVIMNMQALLKADPAVLTEAQRKAREFILQDYTPEEAELYYSARCQQGYERVWKMMDERRAREQKDRRRKRWQSSQAGQVLRRFRTAFEEYKALFETNAEVSVEAMEFDEPTQRIFQRLRTNIEKAHSAPRCGRIMANGRRCRAPRLRGKKLCHMHLAMEELRPQKLDLPGLDNPNDIQLAIAKVAQALVDGKLETKAASTLSYVLQLALSNVNRLDYENIEGDAKGK
jgi:hypothetical protein